MQVDENRVRARARGAARLPRPDLDLALGAAGTISTNLPPSHPISPNLGLISISLSALQANYSSTLLTRVLRITPRTALGVSVMVLGLSLSLTCVFGDFRH